MRRAVATDTCKYQLRGCLAERDARLVKESNEMSISKGVLRSAGVLQSSLLMGGYLSAFTPLGSELARCLSSCWV